MPKMFSANPRVSTTATSKKSTSTNNTSTTRSMRLSQLTRSSKLSVNRTLANVFGPTDIYLSATTILYNVSAGIEIGRISSKDVNSFSFVYTLNDTTHFYVQGDKLYTNAIFTDRTINGYTTQITSNDGTYSFSKTFFISFQKPPVVANLIAPIIVSQGQTATVIDITNTFYDANGHILTYTLNNDNPDLLSVSINEYKLRLTYNTSNTGISNITITAYDDYNEFAVTMFSVLVVPLNPQYTITVNPMPDVLPDPIVNIIDGEITSYTELDSSYVNMSVDDYNTLSEDEKRNLVKTNITSLISKYASTINPDTGNVDPDVILDVYAPIDMLPFPSLGFNIDKVRIIDGSKQGNIDITNNIENSALYVYTKPGSIVSISLINDDVISVEQLTNTTFNVSINNNPSEVKNTGDFINLPNDRVIILSSILITKNNPPVAYDINYSFNEDTTLNVIDLSGSDIDVETNRVSTNYIRYIISALPQHGIIDVLENEDLVSKEIKYTPTANYFGTDTISYYIKDNYGIVSNTATVNINVININDVPEFNSTPLTTTVEDSVYTYEISVSDLDFEIVSFTSENLPSWLTLTDNGDNTATLTGTPLQENVGNNYITIIATDPAGGTSKQEFTISVANVNDAPLFTSSDITTTNEDSVYTYTITVSDEDGDNSTITANTLPNWLTLTDNGDNTATLTGTPLQEHVGNNSVIIVASDPNGSVTNHSFTISVANVNDAPVFTSSDITTTNEDSVYTYTITVSDEDGDISAITANTLPNWLTLTDNGDNTATLIGTPLHEHVGDNNIIIVASDPNGGVTNHSFTISVANVNDAPVFTSSDITTTNEDSVYTYTITVSDEDGDISTITANTLPTWLTLTDNGDNTATLSGTPLQEHVGNNSVIIVASDPNGGITNHSFTISVANVNDAPVFTSSDITTINEDSVYTYTITVSDEDGDISAITANTLPNWLTLTDNGDNTAILTGTPLQENVGDNNVIIVASDPNGGVTNHSFTISVANVNVQPTGQLDISGVVMEGETVEADTTDIEDEDGILTYTYQWELSTDNINWTILTGETYNTFIVPKDEGNVGDYIRVKAVSSDPYGNTTSHTSSSYEILIFNDPPTDIQISSNEIYESYEIGKEIGTLTSSDIDSTVFTYSVNDNKFIINNDKLFSNHVFEYGPNNTYAIDITTTDETANNYTKTINILVKRLWEYTILSSTTVAIGDNTNNLANGTVLGTNLTGSIIIPSTIYDNGNTYTVTNIYQNAFNGSNVDKIIFSGDTTYTLDIPLKQNFQVTQVDEEYVLHQLEEV